MKHKDSTKPLGWILALGVSASVLLYSTNANAAERVVLKYGSFQGTISVKDLNKFVENGQITPAIAAYLKVARQEPPLARKALTAELKANRVFLNNLLSSWAGLILLNQMGKAIHPPASQPNNQALRSALASSISQNGSVTLLGTIRNYPVIAVEIEGDRLSSVFQRLSELTKNL